MRVRAIHAVWIGCIFNGIHIAAWKYPFPTHTEALLWHIATVGACGAVACMWAASFLPGKRTSILLTSVSVAFYVLCRIFITGEAFCSFRSVPVSMYRSPTWQNDFNVGWCTQARPLFKPCCLDLVVLIGFSSSNRPDQLSKLAERSIERRMELSER